MEVENSMCDPLFSCSEQWFLDPFDFVYGVRQEQGELFYGADS